MFSSSVFHVEVFCFIPFSGGSSSRSRPLVHCGKTYATVAPLEHGGRTNRVQRMLNRPFARDSASKIRTIQHVPFWVLEWDSSKGLSWVNGSGFGFRISNKHQPLSLACVTGAPSAERDGNRAPSRNPVDRWSRKNLGIDAHFGNIIHVVAQHHILDLPIVQHVCLFIYKTQPKGRHVA